ncbi:MAG: phosphate ABC transporter substrate-binding/OmpA family protein [Hyphomicrobiaceae bacterium]
MSNQRKITTLLAATVGWVALTTCSTLSEEISLRLKGGNFELSGQLSEYDGKQYTLISPTLGRMTVEATRFVCVSDSCPRTAVRVSATSTDAERSTRDVEGSIIVAGSNTIGSALMPSLIEAYAGKYGFRTQKIIGRNPLDLMFKISDGSGRELATVDLRRHGSSNSFQQLEARAAEIGMSSRPIKQSEVKKLAAAGLGNMTRPTHEHVLSLDGLIVIVSQNNPAVSIPRKMLPDIFAGKVTDWSELGLPPARINVYAPTEDSGTFETFSQLVLKPAGVKISSKAKRTVNLKEQSDWVAADPLGIGIVGIAYQRNAKALNIEMPCGLISQPSIFSMKTEEYPLTRRLYLYTPGRPKSSLALGLCEFAMSSDAQPIIRDLEFIDQAPEILPVAHQNARIAFGQNSRNPEFSQRTMHRFLVDTRNTERLTTTLRFRTASFALDNKAQRDVRRLAALLKSGKYKDREVMLLGFADPRGRFQYNMKLSRQRAEAVQAALRAKGIDRTTVSSYSEMAPVACNDTREGLAFNRRVEVWLKRAAVSAQAHLRHR